jgi:tetratricopeptide (TPR) repeat protein
MKSIKLVFLGLAFLMGSVAFGQSESELWQLAMKYKKEVDNVKLLQVMKKLHDIDAENQNYLSHLSFAYSKVGANLDDEALKLKYYAKAKEVAAKSKGLKAGHAFSHYAYALALARENENAKTKVKIANAKEIKSECDKALELNPKEAGAYHILGRWHRTFAGFSNMEKAMVNTFFGGTPKGGTYKDALKMFQKAIELEPWYMLHVYELAVTYHEMGNDEYAKKYVEKAMKLPQDYEDAKKCYVKCKELLEELK